VDAGDLIYIVAFVAWLLSGILGQAAKKRMSRSAPQPPPTAEPPGEAARRRWVEEQGFPEHDEDWEEPTPEPMPQPARPARLAPLSSLPPPPPSVITRKVSLPRSAVPRPIAAPVPVSPATRNQHRELARAIVLAEILDRPVALR
jgi:hypothetical protein